MAVIDRRKLILDAAMQSFSRFGYKATTMDLVAKIANVGKGTIYTFFSTKDDLFDEIIKGALKEMNNIIEQGIREEDTFFHNLFRALDSVMVFGAKYELFAKLRQEERDLGTLKAMEGLEKLESLGIDFLQREIDKAIAVGEIKPCDSGVVAFLLPKIYFSLTMEWRQTHNPMSNEQVKEYIDAVLFKGLLSAGASE